jgi:hypothetical protein
MPVKTKKLSPTDATNISTAFGQGSMAAAKQLGTVLGYHRSTVYRAVQSGGNIG